MTLYELEVVEIAKNRGDSISRQLADIVKKQDAQIIELEIGLKNVWAVVEGKQTEIEALKKEAALQRLSDFTQEIEAKYGITTKWDGITTYHETTEPIGKAQEK